MLIVSGIVSGKRFAGMGLVLLFLSCASSHVKSFGEEQSNSKEVGCQDHRKLAAPDPIVSDGNNYSVILENDHVRVLRYRDKPGVKTHSHHHDPFVLYALSSFRRRLIFPDGTVKERAFNPGDTIWMPEQIHIGENIGTTDTDVVIVEQKLGCTQ